MDAMSVEFIAALKSYENIMGAYLILSSLYQLAYKIVTSERKKMNRRDFLKLLSKSLLAVYFAPQLAENLILFFSLPDKAMLNEETARRKIHRFLIKLNEKIHPETHMILITLRNIIMAQKLITIARDINKEISKKPEIGVVVGASHIGIEGALNLDEKERKEIIGQIMNFAKGIKKNIATIARFDYNSKTEGWELTKFYKDPFLASLET
jgi:pheromone shutdown protein TraB